MRNTLLFLGLFCLCTLAAAAADKLTKKIRMDGRYIAVVMTVATPNFDKATWFLPKPNGTYDAGADTAAEVLAHFHRQDKDRTKDGILLNSYTHSIPDTPKEKKLMSLHLLKIYGLKTWRDAENKLVDELVAACNKEGIPVWINTTMDMGDLFSVKLLTDPKLTLKK
jgi:hypothetical protein